jgi:hypothetical protein
MGNGDEDQSGFKLDKSVVRMVFDAVLALVVATVGYTMHGISNEITSIKVRDKEHADALSLLREKLPLEYVRMDLYLRDRQEMRAVLDRIDVNVREHRERREDQSKAQLPRGTGAH